MAKRESSAYRKLAIAVEAVLKFQEVAAVFSRHLDDAVRQARVGKYEGQKALVRTLRGKKNLMRRSLIEAAIVRLVSAWEIYLADRFPLALLKKPRHLQSLVGLQGRCRTTSKSVDYVLTLKNRPFQSLSKASEVYSEYLGLQLPTMPSYQDVRKAIVVRNAVVHRGGPTKEYKASLGKFLGKKRPDVLLRSRLPAPAMYEDYLNLYAYAVATCAKAIDTKLP